MSWFSKSAPHQPEQPKAQANSATQAVVEAQIPPCPCCSAEGDALLYSPSACCRSYLRTWWASIGA
jgi:hypothetical protein